MQTDALNNFNGSEKICESVVIMSLLKINRP